MRPTLYGPRGEVLSQPSLFDVANVCTPKEMEIESVADALNAYNLQFLVNPPVVVRSISPLVDSRGNKIYKETR